MPFLFGRCESGRALELGCGLGVAVKSGEDVAAHRVSRWQPGHLAVGEQGVRRGECGFGSVDVEYGDRALSSAAWRVAVDVLAPANLGTSPRRL
ncbi:hypothetical protein [Actinomadura oligospora]|uniref:hypothetical protein n=1 Tax=Actinomadura oligospora TaxID=111804 RepID=UPI0004793BD5|nr:hypothetical protein [Actinomadura oligospora]